jgi:group I intron endonuclease
MIGIYKITNKLTNESYIGQSHDIEKRFSYHKHNNSTNIGKAIKRYGIENFSFDILEQCTEKELDEKEIYYIKKFDSINKGYNILTGGTSAIGTNNANRKLEEQDIYDIRIAYKNHERTKDIYEKYKDIISYNYFLNIWEGNSWKHIMPEVYTNENKIYYSTKTSLGENSANSLFTDEEVLVLRERYVNETAKEIYESVKDRCSFQTLQQILWGRYYSYIKYYDKRIKRWIQKII